MTSASSSGGPQCAFEEKQKERERAEWGASEGRAERKSRRALPRQTSPGPRGHREPPFVEGRGATLQPRVLGRPNAAGRAMTSACGLHFN